MNFVATYELTEELIIHAVGVFNTDEELKAAVYHEWDNLEGEFGNNIEDVGVLFSYAGTVYEFRVVDNDWVLATHSGGHYFFLLFAAGDSGWVEDLLILDRGMLASRPRWPVRNP